MVLGRWQGAAQRRAHARRASREASAGSTSGRGCVSSGPMRSPMTRGAQHGPRRARTASRHRIPALLTTGATITEGITSPPWTRLRSAAAKVPTTCRAASAGHRVPNDDEEATRARRPPLRRHALQATMADEHRLRVEGALGAAASPYGPIAAAVAPRPSVHPRASPEAAAVRIAHEWWRPAAHGGARWPWRHPCH